MANKTEAEIEVEKLEAEAKLEKENEEKRVEGLKIIEEIGVKFPIKIVMAHWNKIVPIQNKITSGKITEIESIVEMYQVLNEGTVQNQAIKDKIFNMDLQEFEKISIVIGKVLEKSTDKKK